MKLFFARRLHIRRLCGELTAAEQKYKREDKGE